MQTNTPEPDSIGSSLRRLLVFQFKLALDALRDIVLSPLSIFAFILDAVMRPPREDSLLLKLMALGRRSDRVINLFGEYDESQDYTVDRALSSVEEVVKPHWAEAQRRHSRTPLSDDGGAAPTGTDCSGQKK